MRARMRWSIALLSLLALVVAACGGGDEPDSSGDAASDADWEPTYEDGVLQPLPSGFPSEDLTLIVVDEAGSDDGVFARHLQAALDPVVPVNVQVVDRPDFDAGFGAWEALRYMESEDAGNEGYVMTVTSQTGTVTDLLEGPVAAELDVSVDSLNWVATVEDVPWVILGRTDAPWGNSIEDMIAYGLENPGELKYLSRGPGSAISLAMIHYFGELGLEVEEIVTGDPQEIAIAVGAGAGDFGISLTGSSQGLIEDGRVELLSCTGNVSPCPGGFDHEPPSMGEVADINPDPWGSRRAMFISREVPDAHLAWLYEAVSTAIEDPDFVANRTAIPGLNVVNYGPEESIAISYGIYDAAYSILEEQGALAEGVQPRQ